MGIVNKLRNAWNAFIGVEEYEMRKRNRYETGHSSTYRPDRVKMSKGNERSIITSVFNRISVDVTTVKYNHVKVDKDGNFIEIINSGLNNCITIEANKDQHAKQFLQDVALSLFDEGCIAIVPIDTSSSIFNPPFDIGTMRTAKILQWFPDSVEVEVYNDTTGLKENVKVPKKSVAIIENPHYAIMNEKNSILQRLIRKLNILDAIDEQSGSGKLDLIIQLPYIIKTEARRQQAENRRKDIEEQLSGSKYGIAYTDGSEKITQLNRSVENNLLKQIEYLTSMLYGQLGMSMKILDGTASEQEMLNYRNQTLYPVIDAITLELERKFLTDEQRNSGEVIKYFNDPTKLITFEKLSEFADKFSRNAILTANEIRGLIGFKPVDDPKANELRNNNLKQSGDEIIPDNKKEKGEENQNGK